MVRLDTRRASVLRDGPSRRDVLRAGSLALMGLPRAWAGPCDSRPNRGDRPLNVIVLFLVGGPSHLDTWDPKPDAPEEIRGPFRSIPTRVPGIRVSELFPRMAGIMDRLALVRSVYHQAAPVHDTGHQLMQTGRLGADGLEHPHLGCVLSYLQGSRGDVPAHVLLPRPIGPTGGNLPHGQNAGFLGAEHDPYIPPPGDLDRRYGRAFDLSGEPPALRERYGRGRFGRNCLLARRLVEHGCRFVTVNQFETVFDRVSWDCHGSAPFSSLADYRGRVAPEFDRAFTSLVEDLDRTGLLATTMVLACGEFGRTPRINPAGGRDHHPGCWTVLLAGGPIAGGRVVGASDATGHAPADRPVTPAEIAATVYHALDVDLEQTLPGPDNTLVPLVDPGTAPIHELF